MKFHPGQHVRWIDCDGIATVVRVVEVTAVGAALLSNGSVVDRDGRDADGTLYESGHVELLDEVDQ